MPDNVYPIFKQARDDDNVLEFSNKTDDSDDLEWVTSCLDRIDTVLSSKNTPYARMLAEICSIIDEWKSA
jgi:hypothetical protein